MLVAVRVGNLLDPAELIKLLECLLGPALAQRLRRLLVIPLLPQDFGDLRHPQPRLFLQELERFARRDAAMLPAVADEDHPGADRFGHVKHLEHVPRAELAGLIDQDDAVSGRFLHLLVLQEPGHRVRRWRSLLPHAALPGWP